MTKQRFVIKMKSGDKFEGLADSERYISALCATPVTGKLTFRTDDGRWLRLADDSIESILHFTEDESWKEPIEEEGERAKKLFAELEEWFSSNKVVCYRKLTETNRPETKWKVASDKSLFLKDLLNEAHSIGYSPKDGVVWVLGVDDRRVELSTEEVLEEREPVTL